VVFDDCLLYNTYFLVVSALGAAAVSTLGAAVSTLGVVSVAGVVVSVAGVVSAAFSPPLLQEATKTPIANTKRIFFILLFLRFEIMILTYLYEKGKKVTHPHNFFLKGLFGLLFVILSIKQADK
jgi:hypothetical protein